MHVEVKKFNTKKETYKYLNEQLVLQVKDIKNDVANMANASSLIYLLLDDLNWSGFYLMKDGALALGPFRENRPLWISPLVPVFAEPALRKVRPR